MLSEKEIEAKAEYLEKRGDAPLFCGGFVEGARWANKYSSAEIFGLRRAKDAEIAELVAMLKRIKTAVDEYDADMDTAIYSDLQVILNRYEK